MKYCISKQLNNWMVSYKMTSVAELRIPMNWLFSTFDEALAYVRKQLSGLRTYGF